LNRFKQVWGGKAFFWFHNFSPFTTESIQCRDGRRMQQAFLASNVCYHSIFYVVVLMFAE